MYKPCDTTLCCYLDSLYRYAIVLTRNSTTASDLVQETYARALAAQGRLWTESNVKAWLFTILRNIRLNDLRRHRTAPATIELDANERTCEMAVERSKSPHELYLAKLERLHVREAIRRLPEKCREIIILREYEEMSYEDIADVLGCPVGTVMSRLARARSKLKALLSIPRSPFSQNGVRSEK
jgi:RNA polymerase sigma-70 factor, ECF subfamily